MPSYQRHRPAPRRPKLSLPRDLDIAAHLRTLPPQTRKAAVELFGPEERDELDADWPSWAHDGQSIPANDPKAASWRTWVIMAGRGFGKTRAGAQWLVEEIARNADIGAPLEIALVGATLEDARRVMVEGRSGLLEVAADWITGWHPSLHRLTFRTGATATLFSGAHPNRLRGPEHHLAWCDELAKWEKAADSWDMLQLGLRLGTRPRALITTTPKAGPLLTAIIADPDTLTTRGRTLQNPHISAAYKARVHALYAGTRLGRQELDGELLTDTPGALWTISLLERCRFPQNPPRNGEGDRPPEADGGGGPPSKSGADGEGGPLRHAFGAPPPRPGEDLFTRICIGVDPPTGDGTCGIIACALDAEGIAHVLADHSVTARTPEGWAIAVAAAAAIHGRYFPLSHRGEAHPQNPPHDFVGRGTSGAGGGASSNPPRNDCQVDHAPHGQGSSGGRSDLTMGDHQPQADGGGVSGGTADAASSARFRPLRLGYADPPPRSGEDLHPIPTTIVAETNQGGRMVKAILHTADPNLHVKPATASLNKSDRAAPIAHLFEAGKVVLHGRFPELEAELCGLIAGGGYEGPGASPDRADAMVWALTELMLARKGAPQIRSV